MLLLSDGEQTTDGTCSSRSYCTDAQYRQAAINSATELKGDGVTIFSADGLVQVPFSMADDVIAAQLASISAAHEGYQVFFYEETALLQHAYEHGTIPSAADGAAAAAPAPGA